MLTYLCWYHLFEEMLHHLTPPPVKHKCVKTGVRVLLDIDMDGDRILEPGYQQGILHREALITRYELLDLLCDRFGLPRTRGSYTRLQCIKWTFGQKCIRSDHQIFWSTDTQYPYVDKRRRDVLRIKGTEIVDGCVNALCCEAVLFISISNLTNLPFQVPADVNPHHTFVLGRWFAPHPATGHARDCLHLPVCPGALHGNQCLSVDVCPYAAS